MHLTLRARVLAAFLVALVAFLGALGYGLVKVRGIGAELARVQDVWIPLSQQITQLRFRRPEVDPDDLSRLKPEQRRLRAASAKVRLDYFSDQLDRAQQNAAGAIPRASGGGAAKMIVVVGALKAISLPARDYVDSVNALLAALEKGDAEEISQRKQQLQFQDRRLDESVNFASRAIDDGLKTDATAAEARSRSALFALAALTVVATAFSLGLTLLVGRVLAPIGDLISGVQRISAGDFTRRVAVGGGGEVALLAGEFNRMAESLLSRDARLTALSAFNENVLESVRVGIFVVDQGGLVTGINRAAEEIWAVERAAVLGKPATAIVAPPEVREAIERVRGGGSATRIGPASLASGRVVEVAAVPFVEAGARRGAVVVAEDVGERLEVEKRLLRSERLAAIGQMSSQITHEVRNPLNSLSLNVEMLEEEIGKIGTKDAEAKTLLSAIGREVERLTEITEGYLSFARLPRPRVEPAAVNPVVESLLRFVREEAEASSVITESKLSPEAPSVLADENQLRQALLNVVRNALQAMREKKGGRLSVATRRVNGVCEITVSDDGPGIAPGDLARIFDPFFSTKSEGTGLGLPLTQQIIEEHGGTIACASEPGRGTTFTIRLPAA